jgi:hypothetical protein
MEEILRLKQIIEANYETFNLSKFVSFVITVLAFFKTEKVLEGKM